MSSRSTNPDRLLLAVLLVVALLSGCAGLSVPSQPSTVLLPASGEAATGAFSLNGRIAVKYEAQGFSGSLRWAHSPTSDDILLLSPLGQGVARIVRDAGGVTLTGADDIPHHAASVEALTQTFLGWRLPLHGLEHWVLGQPAPDSGARSSNGPNGRPVRLFQDGWQVDYERYSTVHGKELPGRLDAAWGDTLHIRLVIDAWSLP